MIKTILYLPELYLAYLNLKKKNQMILQFFFQEEEQQAPEPAPAAPAEPAEPAPAPDPDPAPEPPKAPTPAPINPKLDENLAERASIVQTTYSSLVINTTHDFKILEKYRQVYSTETLENLVGDLKFERKNIEESMSNIANSNEDTFDTDRETQRVIADSRSLESVSLCYTKVIMSIETNTPLEKIHPIGPHTFDREEIEEKYLTQKDGTKLYPTSPVIVDINDPPPTVPILRTALYPAEIREKEERERQEKERDEMMFESFRNKVESFNDERDDRAQKAHNDDYALKRLYNWIKSWFK